MPDNNLVEPRDNMEWDITDGVLTVKMVVDPAKLRRELSSTGKSIMVASTGGFMSIDDGLTLSLNLTRKVSR